MVSPDPLCTFCKSAAENPVGSEQTYPLEVTAMVAELLITPPARTATET